MCIPTYNNDKTLRAVIEGVLVYTDQLLIINDGATDTTAAILAEYVDRLTILTFPTNRGKGVALRAGFDKAAALGYEYMITIDSDGQHFPDDIPVFIQALAAHDAPEPLLLIGSRNMKDPSVPGKSSFGNRFSNFWYYVETGIRLEDTQSGFRLYPIPEIAKLRLFTTKFELEIEVIVKLAWRGVVVRTIPIKVLYDPSERVSHFRPFQDFTRISILNTWLVLLTLVYYLPKRLLQRVQRKGIKKFWKENVLKSNDPPAKKAAAIALGVCIGLSPLWGLHTVLVFTLAAAFRLNSAIVFLFSNISLPPLIPFIIYISYQIGAVVLGEPVAPIPAIEEITSGIGIAKGLGQYVVGSTVVAMGMGALFGGIAYLYFTIRHSKRTT